MTTSEKQALIAKIETLPPEGQRRVEGYVDALLEAQDAEGVADLKGSDAPSAKAEREDASDDTRSSRFRWRGALSHLADAYTAEELQQQANEWRIKKALGS